jgi:hypothetical protein
MGAGQLGDSKGNMFNRSQYDCRSFDSNEHGVLWEQCRIDCTPIPHM